MSILAGLVRTLTGVQGLWQGVAPEARQRIYFANHSSHLDSLVLWATIPAALRARVRPAAAKDYWSKGLRARVAQHFGAVLIERHGAGPKRNPLAPLLEALAQGDSLILFPEGTRNPEGQLQPFKSGLFRLAQLYPQVQLVPVYLENLHRILPKGYFLPVPLTGAVVFGAPLQLREDESKHAFLERARAAVLALRRF